MVCRDPVPLNLGKLNDFVPVSWDSITNLSLMWNWWCKICYFGIVWFRKKCDIMEVRVKPNLSLGAVELAEKLYDLHEVRLVFLNSEYTSVQYSTYRASVTCFSAYLRSKIICFLWTALLKNLILLKQHLVWLCSWDKMLHQPFAMIIKNECASNVRMIGENIVVQRPLDK